MIRTWATISSGPGVMFSRMLGSILSPYTINAGITTGRYIIRMAGEQSKHRDINPHVSLSNRTTINTNINRFVGDHHYRHTLAELLRNSVKDLKVAIVSKA